MTRPGKGYQKAMERSSIFHGKIEDKYYKWPCSIAASNYQRVVHFDCMELINFRSSNQFSGFKGEGQPNWQRQAREKRWFFISRQNDISSSDWPSTHFSAHCSAIFAGDGLQSFWFPRAPVAPGTQKNLGFAPAEALVKEHSLEHLRNSLLPSLGSFKVDDFKNTIHIFIHIYLLVSRNGNWTSHCT